MRFFVFVTNIDNNVLYASLKNRITVELPYLVVPPSLVIKTKEESCMTKKGFHEILIGRIKELCKEKNMSYYTLSYKSTIPMTTLLHIVEGETQNPGIFTIMKICDGFGVTMSEFFNTEAFDEMVRECEE